MKAYRNLREWLESQGSPLHFTAGGGDGSMTVAAADTSRFNPGITVYSYRETELPGGGTSFWMSSGWGIRKEWLPAIKGLLDDAAFLGIGGPALNRPPGRGEEAAGGRQWNTEHTMERLKPLVNSGEAPIKNLTKPWPYSPNW